jgi:hypothetical protein
MAPSATEQAKASEREALTARILPKMVLSAGDQASMTGPPVPAPPYLNAEGRATLRFAVEGNAMFVLKPPNPKEGN